MHVQAKKKINIYIYVYPPIPLLHKWPHTAKTVLHLGFSIWKQTWETVPCQNASEETQAALPDAGPRLLVPTQGCLRALFWPRIARALGLWGSGRQGGPGSCCSSMLCRHLRAAARTGAELWAARHGRAEHGAEERQTPLEL